MQFSLQSAAVSYDKVDMEDIHTKIDRIFSNQVTYNRESPEGSVKKP